MAQEATDPVLAAARRAGEVCALGGATRVLAERAIYRAARGARVASTPQAPWSGADEDAAVAATARVVREMWDTNKSRVAKP